MQKTPPPLPARPRSFTLPVLLLLIGCSVFTLVFLVLYCGGRLHYYSITSESMKPAISRNESVFTEGISYFFREPNPGEIVVYRSQGPPPPGYARQEPDTRPWQIYVHRFVGKAGDTLRITDGKLYVNDKAVPMANDAGEITYVNVPFAKLLTSPTATFTVPEGHCFVLGDNSTHSLDSRFIGAVPLDEVRGRVLGRK